MIVTVFRSRLREERRTEYEVWAHEMEDLAHTMPGFISIKTFRADDGERVSIVEFANWEALKNWAHHPRHREAQRLGREKFYLEFHLQSGEVTRESHFVEDMLAPTTAKHD